MLKTSELTFFSFATTLAGASVQNTAQLAQGYW
jgi:hypothetical protein